MTDVFKNTLIEIVKDDNGRIIKAILPFTKKEVNFVYDTKGSISDVQGADGKTLDMSNAVGAVSVPAALYGDTDEEFVGNIPVSDKIVDLKGNTIVLEFNEEGKLVKESNPKFVSRYFLKEKEVYGPRVTARLSRLYGNMAVMIREMKTPEGKLVYEEVLFGNVLSQTEA